MDEHENCITVFKDLNDIANDIAVEAIVFTEKYPEVVHRELLSMSMDTFDQNFTKYDISQI